MQKYVLCILLLIGSALCAYPDAGVFNAIGDDFSSVLSQQQNILTLIQSLSVTCCDTTPVETCTGIPITQADVNAGTFIISSSGTYCVEEDLTWVSGAALIDIQADDVTLNLNGHTLDGNGGPTQVVRASSQNNIVVKNGTIRDASSRGLDLASVDNFIVEGITSTESGFDGITITSSNNFLVKGCNATNNNFNGIRIISSSSGTVIGNSAASFSQFNNNGNLGLSINNSGVLLRWCTAQNNVTGYLLFESFGLMTECSASGNSTRPVQTNSFVRFGYQDSLGIITGSIFAPALSAVLPVIGTTSYNFDMGGNT